MTELLARYRTPRTELVRLIVVHTNESADIPGGAAAVAKYCQRPSWLRSGSKGGYHRLVDNAEVVLGGYDTDVVNGAAGANGDGWHVCLIGYAAQTSDQWGDEYSQAAIKLAAREVAAACRRLKVPAFRIGDRAVHAGESGICGHVDVSRAYLKSTHTDPGVNFPWDQFMSEVRSHLVEVKPMYDPPLTLPPVVASLGSAQGGAWVLGKDGSVWAFGGARYHGGANGKPYFQGREAAQLVPPNPAEPRKQYVIVSSDGARYAYPE